MDLDTRTAVRSSSQVVDDTEDGGPVGDVPPVAGRSEPLDQLPHRLIPAIARRLIPFSTSAPAAQSAAIAGTRDAPDRADCDRCDRDALDAAVVDVEPGALEVAWVVEADDEDVVVAEDDGGVVEGEAVAEDEVVETEELRRTGIIPTLIDAPA
jgi:hypothetical protein